MIILHVGTQKTGSSSIQHFLRDNQHELKLQNVNFVSASRPWIDHNTVARELRNWEGSTPLLDAVLTEVQDAEQSTHIISGEMLFHKDVPGRFSQRLRDFSSVDVKVIVYLRRPDHLMESLYKQRVKTGAIKPNPTVYLEQNLWECDYRGVLGEFANEFGEGSIIARPYSRRLLKNGDVVDDFVDIIGVQPSEDFARSKPEDNPTFSAAISELMGFCVRNTPLQTRDLNEFISKLSWDNLRFSGDVYSQKERLDLMLKYDDDLREVARKYGDVLNDVFNYDDLKEHHTGLEITPEQELASHRQAGRALIRAMWEIMENTPPQQES